MWSDVPCRYILKVEKSDSDVAFDITMPDTSEFGRVTVQGALPTIEITVMLRILIQFDRGIMVCCMRRTNSLTIKM